MLKKSSNKGFTHRNFLKKVSGGFTLIELLVVVAIIGVLSSVTFVFLGDARNKAKDTKKIADLKQLQNALDLYFADYGSYPGSDNIYYISDGHSTVSGESCRDAQWSRATVLHFSDVFDSNFIPKYISVIPTDPYNCFSYRKVTAMQNYGCFFSPTDFVFARDYYYYLTFDAQSDLPKNTYPSLGNYDNTMRCILGPAK